MSCETRYFKSQACPHLTMSGSAARSSIDVDGYVYAASSSYVTSVAPPMHPKIGDNRTLIPAVTEHNANLRGPLSAVPSSAFAYAPKEVNCIASPLFCKRV